MTDEPRADDFEETAQTDPEDVQPPGEPPAGDVAEDVGESHDEATGSGPATGHPAVDEVLRSLEDLEGRPVEEHVGAFEQAHETLRRALSDAGDDQA